MANHKLTDEQRKIFVEKCRKTKTERYGDPTYNNMAKNRQTKLDRYGDEHYNNYEKSLQTNLDRYGSPHHNQAEEIRDKIRDSKLKPETQQKYENTMKERYGEASVNLVPSIVEKRSHTMRERYGTNSPLQNKEVKARQLETLKNNNSYCKSKIEEGTYKYLVSIYGKEDVVRQYGDSRYPYNCDFYVKCCDLFIEVNNHPSHGTHPFDPTNDDDLKLLEELKSSNTAWSNMIVSVWAGRDVEKFKCAKANNLNYKVIYRDISEIIDE